MSTYSPNDEAITQIQEELKALQRAEVNASSVEDPEERQYVVLQIRHKLQDWLDLEKEIMEIKDRTRPTVFPQQPDRHLSSREGRISYLRKEARSELRSLTNIDPWMEVEVPKEKSVTQKSYQSVPVASPSYYSTPPPEFSPPEKLQSKAVPSKPRIEDEASPWPYWKTKEEKLKAASKSKKSPKNIQNRKQTVKNRQNFRKGCELVEKHTLRSFDRDPDSINVNAARERVKKFDKDVDSSPTLRYTGALDSLLIADSSPSITNNTVQSVPAQSKRTEAVRSEELQVNFVQPLRRLDDPRPRSPFIANSEVIEYLRTFPPTSPTKVGKYRVTLSPSKNEINVGATLPPLRNRPPPAARSRTVNLLTGAPLDTSSFNKRR